jgi:hypothetical protein
MLRFYLVTQNLSFVFFSTVTDYTAYFHSYLNLKFKILTIRRCLGQKHLHFNWYYFVNSNKQTYPVTSNKKVTWKDSQENQDDHRIEFNQDSPHIPTLTAKCKLSYFFKKSKVK